MKYSILMACTSVHLMVTMIGTDTAVLLNTREAGGKMLAINLT